ncbi:MAG: PEP/pyruvate-binding domain-containing protein [bacterium]
MTAVAGRIDSRLSSGANAYARPLEACGDVSLVGEKAHTLGRMMRVGVLVPPGFVLTTRAFDDRLATLHGARDLRSQIAELSAALDLSDPESLRVRSQEIRAAVSAAPLSNALRDELFERSAALLERGPVVVRSSAIGEDSAGHSLAGQLDSILHVTTTTELERAVLDCWASYWSERAISYCARTGVARCGMGVIVQQQVDARAAGVLFTEAGNGSMLVEYTAGLGDALVSGAIDPGRISIARDTRTVRHLARASDTGTDGDAIDPDLMNNSVTDALFAVGSALERELGGPQDVEWAVDGVGALYIVQSRPITAPVLAPSANESRSGGRRVAWSNANVNENFPGPISPLLYSIASVGYTHYFRNLARAFGISRRRIEAMEPSLRQIIGVHGARMYYNLSSIHSVLRLAPFGQELTESFDAFVGADGSNVAVASVAKSSTAKQVLEVAVIAVKTTRQFLFLRRRIERFERTADRFAEATHPSRLETMSLGELRTALNEFIDVRCNKWLDASLADAASMVCYGALERLLRKGYSDGSNEAVHTSLLKAIPDVISGEPVHRLWALSRMIRADAELRALIEHGDATTVLSEIASKPHFDEFRAAFQRYLDEWGFRCSEELMLTSPSFAENPAPLIDMLRAYARIEGASPADALAKQEAEREHRTKRVLADLSGRRLRRNVPLLTYANAVRVLLPWTHAAIRFRERARMKQALLYSRCRRIALAIGEELVRRDLFGKRDDIFFLTASEIDQLASGAAMFPQSVAELVAVRARAHVELAATTPPDAFTLGEGEYLTSDAMQGSASATGAASEEAADVLKGTSACGGRVTGRAAVLRDVTEASRIEPGDVLVTKQTDPGWGPVFFLISGLVIERGGMLSHGAIIAREFGIPCVVGVRNAMSAIPAGSKVTVDGDSGQVHVDR